MIVLSLAHNPPRANMLRFFADLLAPDALALGRHREALGLDAEVEVATPVRLSRCPICRVMISDAARLACGWCES